MKRFQWFDGFTRREWALLAMVAFCTAAAIGAAFADKDTWEAIGAIGSFLGAVIAACAVFLTWEGFRQAQRTERAEYRSYLIIRSADLNVLKYSYENAEFGFAFSVDVDIKNYGRTPASDLIVTAKLHLPQWPSTQTRTVTRKLQHPTAEYLTIKVGQMVQSSREETTAGSYLLTIDARYTDIFGTPHTETWVGNGTLTIIENPFDDYDFELGATSPSPIDAGIDFRQPA